jgi:transposase
MRHQTVASTAQTVAGTTRAVIWPIPRRRRPTRTAAWAKPVWRQDTLTPPLATSRTQSRTHARAKPYLADDLQLELSHFGWRTGENGGYLAPDGVHLKHGQALETEVQQGVQAETIALVRSSAKPMAEICRDMGLAESTVQRWVAQADVDVGQRPGPTTAEHEEIVRLRREIRVVSEERDVLAKAIAFFTKGTTR